MTLADRHPRLAQAEHSRTVATYGVTHLVSLMPDTVDSAPDGDRREQDLTEGESALRVPKSPIRPSA